MTAWRIERQVVKLQQPIHSFEQNGAIDWILAPGQEPPAIRWELLAGCFWLVSWQETPKFFIQEGLVPVAVGRRINSAVSPEIAAAIIARVTGERVGLANLLVAREDDFLCVGGLIEVPEITSSESYKATIGFSIRSRAEI